MHSLSLFVSLNTSPECFVSFSPPWNIAPWHCVLVLWTWMFCDAHVLCLFFLCLKVHYSRELLLLHLCFCATLYLLCCVCCSSYRVVSCTVCLHTNYTACMSNLYVLYCTEYCSLKKIIQSLSNLRWMEKCVGIWACMHVHKERTSCSSSSRH